jgi:hypothetical protein
MAKALYGFVGEPRAAMLLRQLEILQQRVRELETALEASEVEVMALRAMADSRTIELEEEGALA